MKFKQLVLDIVTLNILWWVYIIFKFYVSYLEPYQRKSYWYVPVFGVVQFIIAICLVAVVVKIYRDDNGLDKLEIKVVKE